MRLQLTLEHAPDEVLPINYPYLIASWIYKTLATADRGFAHRLHEKGYEQGGKQYKLFTYSSLRPARYQIDGRAQTFILVESPTQLTLSFYIHEALQHFVVGMFQGQQFRLGSGNFDVHFLVKAANMLPKIHFENATTYRFRTVTPLCVSRNVEGRKHAQYLAPDAAGYGDLLIQNLLRKQQATQAEPIKEDIDYQFELCSSPKSKLVSIKGIKVRGFLFDFEIQAPKELLDIGYYGGFGEKNSSGGMGMVEIRKR